MELPEVMVFSAEDQAVEVRVGDHVRLVGPFRFVYGAFGQGIYTIYNTYSTTRRENDLWDVQVSERSYFTSRYLPWLPIPLLPRALRFYTGISAEDVNARLSDLVLLSDRLSGPAPVPNVRLDPPPQPPEEAIEGNAFEPEGNFTQSGGSTMPYRVSFVYDQKVARKGGWTENYYNRLTSAAAVQQEAADLAFHLQALHGRSSVLSYRRVQQVHPAGVPVDVPRSTDVKEYQKDLNDRVGVSHFSDYPTNALLLEVGDGADIKIRQWVRGTRDTFIANGGFLDTADPEYTAASQAFINELTFPTKNWVVRHLNPAELKKVVLSISPTGLVTTQEPHGYANGVKVRIFNGQDNKYANKIWRITVTSGVTNTFQLQNWNPPLPFVPITGENIKVKLQTYLYTRITAARFVYATSHYVGRPLNLLGGFAKSRS